MTATLTAGTWKRAMSSASVSASSSPAAGVCAASIRAMNPVNPANLITSERGMIGSGFPMADLFGFLETHRIGYQRTDHPAVFTVEEARRLVPPLPAAKTKNLFLRNKKGTRHFLVVVGAEK